MQENERTKQTMEALENPRVGDRFTEMYSYWMFVLEVRNETVTFISASVPCSLPEDGIVETLSREDFVKKFSYAVLPGAWVTLKNHDHNVAGWLKDDILVPMD